MLWQPHSGLSIPQKRTGGRRWTGSRRVGRGVAALWTGPCLMEPYARPANDILFDELGVGPGVRLLDVACGSGYAAWVAAGRGARGRIGRLGESPSRSPGHASPMPSSLSVTCLRCRSTGATIDQGGTGRPGHAEAMLQDSGLRVDSRQATRARSGSCLQPLSSPCPSTVVQSGR